MSVRDLLQDKIKTRGVLWLIERLVIIFAIVFISCGVISWIRNLILEEPGGVRIAEVVMTRNVDEAGMPGDRTLTFTQTDERIYCVVRLEGIVSTTMLAQWYYGDEEIAGHYFQAKPGHLSTFWIEPPEGEVFRKGNYAVSIFEQQTLVREIRFQVE